MQLPEFISRAIAFFQKAEQNLTAAQELATAQTRILELEASAKTITGLEATIKELQASAVTAATTNATLDTSLAALTTDLVAANAKVTETLAGLGVKPETIPAAGAPAAGAAAGKSLMDQMTAITDPTARTIFYRKNKAAFAAASLAERAGK